MTHRDLQTEPRNPTPRQRAEQAARRLHEAEEDAAAAVLLDVPGSVRDEATRELADALALAEEWGVVGRRGR